MLGRNNGLTWEKDLYTDAVLHIASLLKNKTLGRVAKTRTLEIPDM
jgi:hypothetical protein